ncbi:Response regulator receiver domain-containing protein [Stigmatella aurantiaca]|uniref:Response regulator receiver domain-containing protein n=1 Tax=Stigmatella aurantiaca TaxID=41 RepID=A0A1H7WQL5_STIAU|nr:response regulator [Stigmatella aurantiaca]SEM23308.1 Response regulator receiver domain-containing protein [Stigmatella aurantiaca]
MKTVLLVDDEHAILDALSGILADEGFRVVTAGNGREAVHRLREETPDVALVDVMMPVMDGRELLREMAADDRWKNVPVVLMSAVPLSILNREAPVACADFFQKPFDLWKLIARLRELAGESSH